MFLALQAQLIQSLIQAEHLVLNAEGNENYSYLVKTRLLWDLQHCKNVLLVAMLDTLGEILGWTYNLPVTKFSG